MKPASTRKAASETKETKPPPIKAAGPRKLTFKEKAELAGIEDAISAAEQKVSSLELAVQDPALFKSGGAEVQAMLAELEVAKADVERLFARWQELDAIPKD